MIAADTCYVAEPRRGPSQRLQLRSISNILLKLSLRTWRRNIGVANDDEDIYFVSVLIHECIEMDAFETAIVYVERKPYLSGASQER